MPIPFAARDVPVPNADHWVELNHLALGLPSYTPVEIKGYYIVGLLHDICQCVEILLRAPDAFPSRYLPAFALFASAVDLLGRCITGNVTSRAGNDIEVGFYYLATPTPFAPHEPVDEDATVVETNVSQYTVAELKVLRNFSAHGQAAAREVLPSLHIELLDQFPHKLGVAMETYWHGLHSNVDLCERLGRASIRAYRGRTDPLRDTLEYFHAGNSIASMFSQMSWQVYR